MLNVAVIGVGNMGKHHARVYSGIGNLVAVCDIRESVARDIARRFKCRFYTDHKKMLSQEKIDAVSVAVPTIHHKRVALDCIEQGKHVLVEKPLAGNLEDAKEIISAAKRKGVKLAVGHIERFNPAIRRVKELINSGSLGKIITISVRRVGVVPPQIRDTNIVLDTAIHDIDVLNYITGRDFEVGHIRMGKAILKGREDFADIMLKYGDINVFIQENWITPVKIRNLSVTGTKGYLEMNFITQDIMMYRSNYRNIDDFNDVVKFGTPEKVQIKIEKKEPLKEELKSFLKCVQENREPEVTGEDGLRALKDIFRIIDNNHS